MSANTNRYEVATLADLEESAECVTVEDRKYLVCKVDGEVYAYRNVCPHQKGPIAEGRVNEEDETVLCPWHGWEFDLEGGKNLFETGVADQLPRVQTEIDGDAVYILR